ncbi:MAG: hypothetical protein AB7F35_30970 [Acetobacteraceae bacterium]
MLGKIVLAATVSVACSAGVALAQGGGAGSWVFHSPAKGNCPALDTYIARDGANLSGTVTTEGAQKVSRISGKLDSSNKFKMDVTPIDAGAPKGTITGSVEPTAGVLTAQISGTNCWDGTRKLRFMPRDMFDMGG